MSAMASFTNDPPSVKVKAPKMKEKEKEKEKEKHEKEKHEKQEKEVCGICADTYTLVLRRKITCRYCSKDACSKCIEQYLPSRPEDAHCVYCRVNYSDAVLKEICTKTYLQNTFFRHRQEVLISRERANLPALQIIAQEVRRDREQRKIQRAILEELDALKKEKTQVIVQQTLAHARMMEKYKKQENRVEEVKEVERLTGEEQAIHRRIEQKRVEFKEAYAPRRTQAEAEADGADGADGAGAGAGGGAEEEKGEQGKKKFIRRCMKAGCQGFLSTAWKCGICEHYSCGKCFVVKGATHDVAHICQKDDLETADMIRKDSKPCPNCGEYINKSSGCSQIFCITCKTPWDWDTGRIVTKGVIHNPHYYEWMKQTGGEIPRNPADVPCGGYPHMYELRPIHRYTGRQQAQYFFEFHRLCMELQEHSERNFRSHIDENGLRDIHVQFLLGDFDEREWGRRLAISEKRRKRDAEIQDVFVAFRMVSVELINRIQHYRDETVDSFILLPRDRADRYLDVWNGEVQALLEMVNEGLKTISLTYSCIVPRIISSMALQPLQSLHPLQPLQPLQPRQHLPPPHTAHPHLPPHLQHHHQHQHQQQHQQQSNRTVYYQLRSHKWIAPKRVPLRSSSSSSSTASSNMVWGSVKGEEEKEDSEDSEDREAVEEEEKAEEEEEEADLLLAIERSMNEK